MAESDWVSTGTCTLCGKDFKRTGITRHLKKCHSEHQPAEGKLRKTFHLRMEGRQYSDYWMNIEIPAEATLAELDDFLRDVWLECCGHLSAFTIDGVSYEMDTGGIDGMWSDMFGGAPPQSMEVRLDRVLQPGMEFFHEYDFGSTTYLKLRVADQWEGLLPQDELKVLARNHPPPIACNVCGALATEVCTDCMWGGNGWVCEAHAEEHECGMEMMLPVVNSPRVGVCGYTG